MIMPKNILTNEFVLNMKCPPDRAHMGVFDPELRGFYVDVLASGRKSFRVRYRFDKKLRVVTLGDASLMTLDEARMGARELLRKAKVVGKFVEFFGAGTASLSVTDRATIANMAPEYGATMGFFPVDEKTIAYFEGTGRTKDEIAAVTQVLESGKVNYWTGQEGRLFEKEFAEYCGTKHCIGVANGLDALTLTLRAWLELGRLQPGDEIDDFMEK